MKIINDSILKKCTITIDECFEWVEETFLLKKISILPPKLSLKHKENSFFNIMPSIIPKFNLMGTKIASRLPGNIPLIKSNIFLYDLSTGDLKKILEGNYITTLRTGALAAYNSLIFMNDLNTYEIGLIGLGNVTKMTAKFLFDKLKNKKIKVKLYKYKTQHLIFKEIFKQYENITFYYVESYEEVIRNSDLIISGVSYTNDTFGEKEWFKPGVVVIPIHTKGFQNLDVFADKVIVDDVGHVINFRYFKEFKECIELSEIIAGNKIGRTNKDEIILIYTIGINLLDLVFSLKLLEKIGE